MLPCSTYTSYCDFDVTSHFKGLWTSYQAILKDFERRTKPCLTSSLQAVFKELVPSIVASKIARFQAPYLTKTKSIREYSHLGNCAKMAQVEFAQFCSLHRFQAVLKSSLQAVFKWRRSCVAGQSTISQDDIMMCLSNYAPQTKIFDG